MEKKKNYILGTIFVVLAIIFIFILSRISIDAIKEFDTFVYGLFERNDILTVIMKIITCMGEDITLVLLSLILFITIKNKKEASMIPLNLMIIASINSIVKLLVKRDRPFGISLIEVGGYSFPSGHSAASLAFYGLIIYFIFKKIKNKKVKVVSASLLSLLIFLIGLSRIYLGVHYASDVLGGFAFSGAYLILYIMAYNKFIYKIESVNDVKK